MQGQAKYIDLVRAKTIVMENIFIESIRRCTALNKNYNRQLVNNNGSYNSISYFL